MGFRALTRWALALGPPIFLLSLCRLLKDAADMAASDISSAALLIFFEDSCRRRPTLEAMNADDACLPVLCFCLLLAVMAAADEDETDANEEEAAPLERADVIIFRVLLFFLASIMVGMGGGPSCSANSISLFWSSATSWILF
jgi:hypothetical protein